MTTAQEAAQAMQLLVSIRRRILTVRDADGAKTGLAADDVEIIAAHEQAVLLFITEHLHCEPSANAEPALVAGQGDDAAALAALTEQSAATARAGASRPVRRAARRKPAKKAATKKG